MFWLLTHRLSGPAAREQRRQLAAQVKQAKAEAKTAAAARKAERRQAIADRRAGKRPVPLTEKQRQKQQAEAAREQAQLAAAKRASTRETVDGFVFSFILLILGQAFLVEPFVIPTGSMAPTLYGRHKECECPACGTEFQIGASGEVINDTSLMKFNTRITGAICPNCRRPTDVTEALAFTGDHIIASKWAYELGEPSRWDVFVFKYPENAAKRYIKRLVGLPGETVRIRDGDLYRVETDANEETPVARQQILRKDSPRKQLAMSQLVYDHDRPAADLLAAGWPDRFTATGATADGRGFICNESGDGDGDGEAELTYTHYVPSAADWAIVESGGLLDPQPSLIADFCPYNAFSGDGIEYRRVEEITQGIFWVPDIAIEFVADLESGADGGVLTIELVEGIFRYRCRLDPAAGTASLIDVNTQQDATEERLRQTVPCRFDGAGTIRFAQVDDQLRLWIDGEPVAFSDEAAQLPHGPLLRTEPGRDDLSPVRIRTTLTGRIEHLKLFRDLYYRDDRSRRSGGYGDVQPLRQLLAQQLRDPEAYAATLAEYRQRFGTITIAAGPDEYLAFGDNSPRSRDSRLWSEGTQSVPRAYLVGKAFWIYWPHGVPFLNGGRGFAIKDHSTPGVNGQPERVENYPRYEVPFVPQIDRMTRIR